MENTDKIKMNNNDTACMLLSSNSKEDNEFPSDDSDDFGNEIMLTQCQQDVPAQGVSEEKSCIIGLHGCKIHGEKCNIVATKQAGGKVAVSDGPNKDSPKSPDDHLEEEPSFFSKNKRLLTGLAIGSAVATGAILAPIAVLGAVGAAGFGTGGIVGGSLAASLMSSSAIASGGGVVAGGAIATLQSVGAAGLGVAGTALSATVGGAAAGAAAGGAAYAASHNNGDGDGPTPEGDEDPPSQNITGDEAFKTENDVIPNEMDVKQKKCNPPQTNTSKEKEEEIEKLMAELNALKIKVAKVMSSDSNVDGGKEESQ